MPFLGKTPAQGFVNSVTKDDFTPNGTTTAFTLSKSPATVNEIEVYVGNVRQEPTDAYSVSGTTLTMTEAPATGTNFYVMHIGGTTQSSTTLPGGSTVPGAFSVSGAFTSTGIDDNATSTAITIDASEDIEAGTYSSSGVTNGIKLNLSSNTGRINISSINSTSDMLNFNTTNGEVGSIQAVGSGTIYSTGGSGGGIKLGGTGAANTLDDYEEGTWTPTIALTTGNFGTSGAFDYTKIGRVVHLRGYIYAGSSIADTSAIWQFAGLPFAPSHETYGTVVFYAVNVPGDSLWCNSYCHPSGYVRLYSTRDNAINDWLQWSDVINDHVDFNLTYITAA